MGFLIPLAVGTAATAATVATSGLIGTAGGVTGSGLLAAAGAGASAYGTYQQGQAAEAQGKSQQDMANYNARVAEQEAKAKELRAGFAQKRQAKKAAEIKSSQIAKLAAGGGLGSPVAGDLVAEQASELDLENLLIGYEGQVGAEQSRSQATLDRMQGGLYAKAGKATAKRANIGFGVGLAGFAKERLYG